MTFFDNLINKANELYEENERFKAENEAKAKRGEMWYQNLDKIPSAIVEWYEENKAPSKKATSVVPSIEEESLDDGILPTISAFFGTKKLASKMKPGTKKELASLEGDITEGVKKYPTINDYKLSAFERATSKPTERELADRVMAIRQAREQELQDRIMQEMADRKAYYNKLMYQQ